MSKPTNKDVCIRVGQVWRGEFGTYKIIAIDGDTLWCLYDEQNCDTGHVTVNDGYIKDGEWALISDPVWGDMSAHRIVTEQEKWEHRMHECVQVFNGEWCNAKVSQGTAAPFILDGRIYRIPRDHKWAEAAQEQPKRIEPLKGYAWSEMAQKINKLIEAHNAEVE